MNWFEYAILLAVALVVTMLLIPAATALAKRVNAIDYPSKRRVNDHPVPRLGGVAMFGGIIAGTITLDLGIRFFGWQNPLAFHPELEVNYFGVTIGFAVMFAVGLIDDIRNLKPKIKFAGQLIAACIVAASGLILSDISNPFGGGFIEFGFWSYPITVIYLVSFANIINLIDGLDGLASGITIITATAIAVMAALTGRFEAVAFCCILIGACLGFLKFNFNPAKIFMGDSGALTLGFFLGCVSLLSLAKSTLLVTLLVPIISAGVPVLDTLFAIIRRIREKRPIDEADKGHIHHRLLQSGFTQKQTVLIMWAWTAALAVLSLLIAWTTGIIRLILFILVASAVVFAVHKLNLLGTVLEHRYSTDKTVDSKSSEDCDR